MGAGSAIGHAVVGSMMGSGSRGGDAQQQQQQQAPQQQQYAQDQNQQ